MWTGKWIQKIIGYSVNPYENLSVILYYNN